jgi:TolA-binding protein
VKAGILRREGERIRSLEIYRSLAGDTQSAEGAESAYRVIEALYEAGDYKQAEQAVFTLSDSNSPQTYWVGMAFLTLGDIYAREGDSFQARATYQSIVDGYSPSDDGVVEAARNRISNLK